jgi:tetratricopeptide (TPR) repeat protein
MALRLSPTSGSATTSARDAPVLALLARADDALGRHDLAGWAAAFTAAGELDGDLAFEARIRLVEAAMRDPAPATPSGHGPGSRPGTPPESGASSRPARTAERLHAVASALVGVLEDEPREPVLLNQAGVLLYELGGLAAGEALFRAALRLDPRLPHAARNLEQIVERRRRGTTSVAGLSAAVSAALPVLERRAGAVAARAVPRTDLTISLCMIVKDEEAMLGRCLASVRPFVDEIVVVDTGSTDATVAIAREHGARVLDYAWTNDFAAARNVSLDAATGDWILYLDADEVLQEGEGPRLRALAGRTWREALYLVETNHTEELEIGASTRHLALRLFRNRPGRRFTGRLHEQVEELADLPAQRREVTDVLIEHYGYLGDVRESKGKERRNRELVEQQLADGDDGAFVRFNLGSEHMASGEFAEAVEQFRAPWAEAYRVTDVAPQGFVPILGCRLVESLLALERLEEGERVSAQVVDRFPDFTDVVLLQGHLAHRAGDDALAEERYRRCLRMGDAPPAYLPSTGAGGHLAARSLARLLAARGAHDEAEALLEDVLRRHPAQVRAAETLAELLRARGLPGDEVLARIAACAPGMLPTGRHLVATALHRSGAVDEAERELRAVLEARPGYDAARLELVRVLLLADRLPEAAAEALRVPAGSRLVPDALRNAAFARLADGAPVADVLARTADGLPGAEHALFVAWSGGSSPLAPAAADLALTMLNALARMERFEAFEALAGVFERLGMPWRQRRELLAQLYLRRGFLQSAAEEWMRVVDRDGPDADALRGLAVVAGQMGLEDDAATFLADAEQLAAA